MRSNKECEYIITLKAGKKNLNFTLVLILVKPPLFAVETVPEKMHKQKVKLDNTCKKRKKEHNETVGY